MSTIDITPAIEDIEAEDTITTEAALAEGTDPAEDIEPEEDLVAVRLDPRTVRIEANVRSTVVVSNDMLKSVKRHGVVIPVLGYYDADGQPVIRDGQRRILATIKAGRASLPAYLVPSKDDKRLRIIQQMIANMYREGLTDADEAAALHELTLDGMTPTMIASELTYKPARVKAALAVAENETATKAVTQHQLTLDQAATMIEFDDDAKAVKSLRETAQRNPSDFAHAAQRLRDKRATARQIAELAEGFTSRGITVVSWPDWEDKDTVPLSDLTEHDGTALTADSYEGRGGHRVAIRDSWNGIEVSHFVNDWKKWGLKKRRANGTAVTPWTDAEKKERRELIANNKAWNSAEVVRRDWLAGFLARKTTPKNAALFAATALASEAFSGRLREALGDHHATACALLGVEYRWGAAHPLTGLAEAGRVNTVLLAVVVGALEAGTSRNTWRTPGHADVAYFTALTEWGYPLSDVEGIVLGIKPQLVADEDEDAEGEPDIEPGSHEGDDFEADDESDDGSESEQEFDAA
ncbi:MAG: hypothetical protein KF761_08010 [Salinibacterium sp.]|nr:hypothetical protein [Salinibacterium sp.]